MLPLYKNRIIYSILGLLLCLVGKDGFGQKEANNWFFVGMNALTFNYGPPQNTSCPNPLGDRGTAVASDTAGNLLFYTNGVKVWTKTHQLMQNGDGLLGIAYYQSCIAFRKPDSYRYYYIFTVGNFSFPPNDGIRYSIVDMEANGGEGAVVSKNLYLTGGNDAMDVITATLHKNNRDVWVITRKQQANQYIYASYLVSPTGIAPPVYTINRKRTAGMTFTIGGIKISPNGKKFLDFQNADDFLGDFDNATGTLTKICGVVTNASYLNIGGEFSIDSRYYYSCGAYAGTDYVVYQYDATATDSLAFQNSKVLVGSVHQTAGTNQGQFMWMQAAPDGKIYGVRFGMYNLFSINYPDEYGTNCGFQLDGFQLNNVAVRSLPQFVSSYTQKIYYTGSCAGATYHFTANFQPAPVSIIWDFGDGDTSTMVNPTHIYINPGTYVVTASVVYPDGKTGEAHRDVMVAAKPYPNLGNDIAICKGTSIKLSPGSFASYLWNNSTIDSTLNVADTGLYTVQVTNEFGCMNSDSIRVSWHLQPLLDQTNLNIAPTTCSGTTGAITGLQVIGSPPLTYQWTASGTPISDTLDLYHLGVGLYELNVTDGYGCKNTVAAYTISDAGNVLIYSVAATPAFCNKPDGTLTITAVSGLGKMLQYFIKTGNDTLSQWGNGKFTALTSGTYYAWVSDSSAVCRSAYSWPILVAAISAPAFASVTATAENCGKHDGQIAISMSPGYVPQLQYFILSGTDTVSQWGNPIFKSLSGGSYHVWASDSSGCTSIYPMLVNVDKLTAPVITSVSTTPENGTASDGTITVVGSGSGLTFSLNGSVPQNIGTFGNLSSGTYSIKVTDAIGCDTLFYIEVTNLAVIRLTAIAGDGSACLGNVAVLPLLANSFEHVKSFKVQLKYNSALVTCQNHLNVNPALFADSLHVDLFPATGELSIKWTGKTPVSLQDGSTLVELSFASLNAGQDSLKWDISPGICVFTDSLGNSINRELVQGKVRVYSIPEADVTQPLTTCEGADLQLAANYHTGTGNGTISYLWSGPGGFASNTNSITLTSVTPSSAGQYSVSLSDTNHCQNQYSTEVNVTPTPVSGFTNDTLLFDQTYTLEANPGYYRYTWSTTDSTYSITVTAEGWYKVTLTTIGGCTATDSVLMLTAFAPLTMPNAFTPNGDILNDVFKPVTTPEKISSYTLYMYDRWGKQVYFTNDVTQGWDGIIDGAAAPVGTYVYYVKYSNTSGAVREKRGMVVLVR